MRTKQILPFLYKICGGMINPFLLPTARHYHAHLENIFMNSFILDRSIKTSHPLISWWFEYIQVFLLGFIFGGNSYLVLLFAFTAVDYQHWSLDLHDLKRDLPQARVGMFTIPLCEKQSKNETLWAAKSKILNEKIKTTSKRTLKYSEPFFFFF